jgi:hypothetical protein
MSAEDIKGFLSPPQKEEDEYYVPQAGSSQRDQFELSHMQQALETTDRLRLALRAFAFEMPWLLELSLLCRLMGRVEDPITLEK